MGLLLDSTYVSLSSTMSEQQQQQQQLLHASACGNDQQEETTFRFIDWYRMYRTAALGRQHQLELELQMVLNNNPDLAATRDERGDLPLHHVLCERHGSLDPIPLGLLKTLISIRPDSVRVKDSKGMLPLHLACRYGGYSSYDVIHCLVSVWPEALQTPITLSKSKREMLPLHIACEFGPLPSKIIKLLTEQYPKALKIPNGEGNLPLHIACRGYNVPLNTIKFLYQSYPKAIRVCNTRGELPLHIISGRRSTHASEIIQGLLKVHPEGIRAANAKGELPLHYACNGYQPLDIVRLLVGKFPDGVRITDANAMLPIHHSIKTVVPLLNVIHFLVHEYPDCLTVRDKDGFFPLHYACQFGSVDAIKLFVESNPQTVKDNKNKEGLLPIQIVCKQNNPSPASIKMLGSAYPISLSSMYHSAPVPLNIAKAYCSSATFESSTSLFKDDSVQQMELV